MSQPTVRRILLCHNDYREPGGESSVFDYQVAGLRRCGHQVQVYRRTNLDIDRASSLGRAAVVAGAYWNPRTWREIRRQIDQQRPDVAIVQNVLPLISPSIYHALASRRVPILQAVYNYRLICPDAHLFSQGEICERCVVGSHLAAIRRKCVRGSTLLSAWYASVLGLHRRLGSFQRRIDRFLVPDQFMADKLVAGGYPSARIRVTPNPFFVDDYPVTSAHAGYVIYVGRLVRQKGILTLLDAFRRRDLGLSLVVVGQGELEAEVRARIATPELAGRVEFRGAVWGDAAQAAIAGAAAVVVPSEWYDNLPQIVCQANAMGKPVIASRINGIPEYVVDGDNGLLFPPGDAERLADCVGRIAASTPRQAADWSRRARRKAEQAFDFAEHHRILMSVIEELT